MGPVVIIVLVGVCALAVVAALVFVIARGMGAQSARVAWLSIAFAVVAMLAVVALNLASVLYRLPPLAVMGIAIVAIALVTLFVLLGRAVAWRPVKLLAVIGLLVASFVVFAAVLMSGVAGDAWIQPVYRTTVSQMGEDMGFTPLMPEARSLITDYLPVTEVTEPRRGISLEFEEFQMQQHAAEGGAGEAGLEALVAPGTEPVPGFRIPSTGATRSEHEVQGQRAVGVTYAESSPPSRPTILVFVLEGVEVRMASMGYERLTEGEWVLQPALAAEELVEIAETLEPVE